MITLCFSGKMIEIIFISRRVDGGSGMGFKSNEIRMFL